MPRAPSLNDEQKQLIRSGAAAGVTPTALARNLGVSRGAVLRELSRVPDRTRKAADFATLTPAVAPVRRQPIHSWGLDAIRAARDAQMRGDFAQPVRLAEALRTDDALFTAYHARLAPQASVETALAPRGGVRGEAVAKRAAQSVFAPRSVLGCIHGTMANHGIAVGYVIHEPSDDGQRVDMRLTEWPLEWVKWNPSIEQLETSTRGGPRITITHGDGHWIVFRKFGILPWVQEACVLPASFVWAAHANGLRDWSASSASHGLAKIIGELPEGVALIADDTGAFTPEAAAFLAMLQAIVSGESGAGIRPAGSKADFVSNASTAWQVFQELILNREKAAARIYTGTDAILGAAGGAPGVDISQLFGVASTKVQGDFEAIEQALDVGLYQPWTAINVGDSRYAPLLKYQLPDPDAKAKSEEQASKRERFHAEIERLKKNGFVIDQTVVNAVAAELGLSNPPQLAEASKATTTLTLAPTDVARVVRVREARERAAGLPPFGDERDDMTISELEARGQAEAQQQPGAAPPKAPSPPR